MRLRAAVLVAMLGAVALLAVAGGAIAAQQPSLVIGLLLPGPKNDAGYNQSFYDAVQEVKANIPGVQLIVAEYVADAEAESTMETMIQQGAKMILPCGFNFQYPALAVAEKHSDVVFMHPGGWEVRGNFSNYYATTQLDMYLMGVAAGMMTKTNKLGFIVGMPQGYMLGDCNAFHLGARAVNPKVETHLVFTFSWGDTTKEAAAAQALLDQGCDVITQHLDSPIAVIQTVEAAGAYTIGFMSLDSQKYAPKGWITGLGLTWGAYLTQSAQAVIDGTWHTGFVRQGLAGGFTQIAPFGSAVPDRVKQFILALATGYKAGLIDTFIGPVKDQAGVVRIAAGEVWGNDKMGDFDWLVEGIVGTPQ
ncbi:MAG: BMP family ABC transporter substrate-binding protein [Chloroflexi bacterium]|nr:BMP family ABC transporter substrate-binding protein [Chloroflexota bacterium]